MFTLLPASSPAIGTSANNCLASGYGAGVVSEKRWPVGLLITSLLNRLRRILPRGKVRAVAGWADGRAASHADGNRRNGSIVVKKVGWIGRTEQPESNGWVWTGMTRGGPWRTIRPAAGRLRRRRSSAIGTSERIRATGAYSNYAANRRLQRTPPGAILGRRR